MVNAGLLLFSLFVQPCTGKIESFKFATDIPIVSLVCLLVEAMIIMQEKSDNPGDDYF